MQKRKRDDNKSRGVSKKSRPANFVKAVQRVIRRTSETKVCDTYQTPTVFSNLSPIAADLCQIAVGTTDVSRVGSKITPVGMIMRYWIDPQSTQTWQAPVRVVIVQDFRQSTSVPQITDFLKDANGASSTGTAYLMPKAWEDSPNFRIIHDSMDNCGPYQGANSSPYGHFKIITPKAFKDVHYKGNGAAVNENSSGRLFLYILTNVAASVSSLPPQISYHVRMYYKDL